MCIGAEQCGGWSLAPAPRPGCRLPALCQPSSPAPLSSPVYFTGLVPAAIFAIGGAVPALILGEREAEGGRRPSPLHTPGLILPPQAPAPALPHRATLLSSRSSACIQMGLLSPGGRDGAVTSLSRGPLLVGLDT